MHEKDYLITAAGGNGTAIRVIDHKLSRQDYAEQGQKLGQLMEPQGAEQAGFLIPSANHFEMAGGEFCGNASRAAAILFSELNGGAQDVQFTVSGFNGTVTAHVEKHDPDHYRVRCIFPGMPTDSREVVLSNGQTASVVDLGGIVHVVIEAPFPSEKTDYESQHTAIVSELGLADREAVGVVWFERAEDSIVMHPVVWVKGVSTFFYEQSCGSGTIAVGRVTGAPSVIQPTTQRINAHISNDAVTLESEMEVIREHQVHLRQPE